MVLDLDEKDLKHSVLGLVVALVEIIGDALKLQALRRMEGGSLTRQEVDRLGQAFLALDVAIEQMKREQGIAAAVQAVRDDLDQLADDLLARMAAPAG